MYGRTTCGPRSSGGASSACVSAGASSIASSTATVVSGVVDPVTISGQQRALILQISPHTRPMISTAQPPKNSPSMIGWQRVGSSGAMAMEPMINTATHAARRVSGNRRQNHPATTTAAITKQVQSRDLSRRVNFRCRSAEALPLPRNVNSRVVESSGEASERASESSPPSLAWGWAVG